MKKLVLIFIVYVIFSESSFSSAVNPENLINFSVYQNKEEGYLKVRLYQPLEQKMRITVYDKFGDQVYLSFLIINLNSAISVDISYFEPGLYTLCLETDENERFKEILIE